MKFVKNYFVLTTKFLLILSILIVDTLAQSLEYNEQNTLGYTARSKLKKVYQAIGIPHQTSGAIKVLNLLTESWSKYDKDTRWANNLKGNGCPLEFSLSFKYNEELPIVRIAVEPQESPFTLQSSWKVGLELKEKLKKLPEVDVSKLDKIHKIFAPATNTQIPTTYESFSLWYAADLESSYPTKLKVYLNPRILGGEKAHELVQKALIILGAEAAWDFLFSRLSGSDSKLAFFSLDLTGDDKARFKVYVANKLINDIERQLEGCTYYVRGTASRWIKTLIDKEDFFNLKPILVTFNFTMKKGSPVPTIHIPVDAYVKNDQILIQRLSKFLTPRQIKLLTTVISEVSGTSLDSGNFLTFISLRPLENGQLDITCYLAL